MHDYSDLWEPIPVNYFIPNYSLRAGIFGSDGGIQGWSWVPRSVGTVADTWRIVPRGRGYRYPNRQKVGPDQTQHHAFSPSTSTSPPPFFLQSAQSYVLRVAIRIRSTTRRHLSGLYTSEIIQQDSLVLNSRFWPVPKYPLIKRNSKKYTHEKTMYKIRFIIFINCR